MRPGWVWISSIYFAIYVWVHITRHKRCSCSSDGWTKSWIVGSFLIVCILDDKSSQIGEELCFLVCVEHHVLWHLLSMSSRWDRCLLSVCWAELWHKLALISWLNIALIWSETCLAAANHSATIVLIILIPLMALITSTDWIHVCVSFEVFREVFYGELWPRIICQDGLNALEPLSILRSIDRSVNTLLKIFWILRSLMDTMEVSDTVDCWCGSNGWGFHSEWIIVSYLWF